MIEAPDDTLKPTDLAKAIGISTPYASQILSGARVPPMKTAVRIFKATGRKIGPLADATDREAKTLARFEGGL